MKLSDFERNVYSQFGEDGVIERIFQQIGEKSRLCVEFGAGDGLECSNVAHLWQNGWNALLIEADQTRFAALESNINENCVVIKAKVEPTGENAIDKLVPPNVNPDLMVMDVDGDDYYIWQNMQTRPRIICVEFNFTVPPHLSLRQEYLGGNFSASIKAYIDLAREKGYTFIGNTHCNAFFVIDDEADLFSDYETNLDVLFPRENFAYVVTDFNGNALGAGRHLPFGVRLPYITTPVTGDHVFSLTNDPHQTFAAYGSVYPYIVFWKATKHGNIADPQSPARKNLNNFLHRGIPVAIPITNVSNMAELDWIRPLAKQYHFEYREGGGVIALVRS